MFSAFRRVIMVAMVSAISCHANAVEYKVVNANAEFPEGPIVIDGNLYYVETGGDRVSVWDGTANKTVFYQKGCGANSVIGFENDLLVACYFENAVVRITRDGKIVQKITKGNNGADIVGPNDFSADGKGGVYVTASGPWEPDPIVGKVFHIDKDLNVKELASDISYANGILLSQDGSRLLVGEPEAAGRIISFAVNPDGTLSDRRVFIRLVKDDPGAGPDAYPDGFKWGPDGNLYIGEYSGGRVAVFSPTGKFIRAYDVPAKAVPNLTFSSDGKIMYLMTVDDKEKAPWRGKVLEVSLEP